MPHLERGVVIAGKYRLVEALEQGGMGAVWVAHHQDLGVDVALKFVLPTVAARDSGHTRFRREARAAARLKSPHTAQIYDYGVDQGLAYIAMELLEGRHLGSELKRRGRLPPARVAAICGQVAKALGEAHEAGIVHRDVKPPNIFLAQVAGEEMVKLLDFGIAKVLAVDSTGDHIATDTGTMLGTPRYMSPEQACGDPVDYRSDLFSLAAVAFEALTGTRLFSAQHLGELVVQVTNAKVPPIQTVRPELPAVLDDFFSQAAAVNPELRFQSASAFAAALTAACAGETWLPPSVDDDTLDGAARPVVGQSNKAPAAEVTRAPSYSDAPVDKAPISGTVVMAKQDGGHDETAATSATGTALMAKQGGGPSAVATSSVTRTAVMTTPDDGHSATATTSVTSTTSRADSGSAGGRARKWTLAAALLAAMGAAWWGLSAASSVPTTDEAMSAVQDSASPATAAVETPAPPALASPGAPGMSAGATSAALTDRAASPSARPSASTLSQPASAMTPRSGVPPSTAVAPRPGVAAGPTVKRPPTSRPITPVRPKPKPRDGIFDPQPKR